MKSFWQIVFLFCAPAVIHAQMALSIRLAIKALQSKPFLVAATATTHAGGITDRFTDSYQTVGTRWEHQV